MVKAFLLALSLLISAGPCLAGTPDAAGPGERKQVMMLLWRGCEELCQGFKSWFERRHLPVAFEMRDARQDRRRLAELVEEAREGQWDLVLTWGTTVSLAALGTLTAPAQPLGAPAVFANVTDPIGSGLAAGPQGSGRAGIAGSMSVVPDDVQINAIRRYRPMRRLGVAYNTDEPNAVDNVKRLRALAGPMEFELVEVPVPVDASGRPDPAAIPEVIGQLAEARVDFVYIGSSSFLLSNVVAFTEAAVAAGLPVASAGEVPIRQGTGLLGVVSPNFVVGLLAGSQAEKILFEGVRAEDLTVASLKDYAYLINIDTAKRLRLAPPMSLLRNAVIVGKDQGVR
jgi:putative tryptophan/tyrosine transport system substrate-binding protein